MEPTKKVEEETPAGDSERGQDVEEVGRKLPQFLAGGSANIIAIVLGTILGWSSPSIRKLKAPDSPVGPINDNEDSWISSLMPLAAAVGPIAAGYCAQRFGRKRALLIASVPMLIHYIMIAVADAVWVIYLARIIVGFVLGWTFTVLPMYTSEIAQNQYRGALGTMLQFSINVGLLYDYCIGPFVEVKWLSVASLVFPVLFFVLFFMVPESPYFLLTKGKDKQASKALQWLRGKSEKGVATELKIIKTDVEESLLQDGGFKEIFGSKPIRKAVALCLGLMFFQQFSGINAVLFNAESIFANAGGALSSEVSAIIVGLIMVLAAFPTPYLVERLGRRVLLIASSVGMCISLAVLGLYFYLSESGNDTSSYSILPVISLVVYLIAYSPGFGPLPWAVMGEMYPGNIKALGSTLAASFSWLLAFLVTRFFNDLVNAVDNSWTFWIFAICCGAATPFVYFLLPETKGKTVAEIHQELS